MTGYEHITVSQISSALGAEVSGVDLARPEEAACAEISRAFLTHQVLLFRDQELSPAQLIRLAARFGGPSIYPFAEGLPGFPAVTEIINEPHQTSNFGGMWHSDTTYLPEPPKATLLHAVETPSAGGDTLFANMCLAYEALSEGFRSLLDRLEGVNAAALHGAALRGDTLETGPMTAAGPDAGALVATHPAVRVHPETGRRALYVNPSHTAQFAGWTEAESRPLLDFLFAHGARPEFTCRLRWRKGSLALWDNRCTWHRAINDYHGRRRVMRRVSIAEDRPRGAAEG
jgi:taurine dioxygenase